MAMDGEGPNGFSGSPNPENGLQDQGVSLHNLPEGQLPNGKSSPGDTETTRDPPSANPDSEANQQQVGGPGPNPVADGQALGVSQLQDGQGQLQQQQAGVDSSALGSKPKPARPDKLEACPRCGSTDTKFCYYNNYNMKQPRYFCKTCQRYWTAGGTLRNVPPGSGRRKSKSAAAREAEKTAALTEQLAKQTASSSALLSSAALSTGAYLNPMLAAATAADPTGAMTLAYNAAALHALAASKLPGAAAGVNPWAASPVVPGATAAAAAAAGAGLLGITGADLGMAGLAASGSNAALTAGLVPAPTSDSDLNGRAKRAKVEGGATTPTTAGSGGGDDTDAQLLLGSNSGLLNGGLAAAAGQTWGLGADLKAVTGGTSEAGAAVSQADAGAAAAAAQVLQVQQQVMYTQMLQQQILQQQLAAQTVAAQAQVAAAAAAGSNPYLSLYGAAASLPASTAAAAAYTGGGLAGFTSASPTSFGAGTAAAQTAGAATSGLQGTWGVSGGGAASGAAAGGGSGGGALDGYNGGYGGTGGLLSGSSPQLVAGLGTGGELDS